MFYFNNWQRLFSLSNHTISKAHLSFSQNTPAFAIGLLILQAEQLWAYKKIYWQQNKCSV